ncbi:right-handed parallel beta-helix repeat-containing protein [Thiorhodococcus fuscus]|uniref:Right-handed parallel beta-helix repeat-containing protein n=1 Tax=Thiorhodococcus fuscus TaxID=527200 RepID=A0ABW4Y8G5_9GAMM
MNKRIDGEQNWLTQLFVSLSILRNRKSHKKTRPAYKRKLLAAWTMSILCLGASVAANAATKYVRPKAGGPYGSGNGSSYSNAFSGFAAISVNSGDTLKVCGSFNSADASTSSFLFLFGVSGSEGNPTVVDGDCSEEGDLAQASLNASGRQFGIYIDKGSSYITIKNMEVFGVDSEPLYNRFLLRLGSTGTQEEVSNITVSKIKLHDAAHLNDKTEADGIWGACNNCLIDGNEIYNIPADGIWLGKAENTEISNNYVHHVATNGLVTGDCTQVARAPNLYVHNNIFDHSNTEAKQALIVSVESPNARIMNNQLLMSTAQDQTHGISMTANIQSDEAIISGNYISGGWTALAVSGNNVQINNNIIINPYGNAVISADNSSGQYFYNNTVDCGGAPGVIGFNLSGKEYSRAFKNNIITRCQAAVSKGGTASKLIFEDNLLFKNTDNDLYFTMSESNIVADPKALNASGSYSNPKDYTLLAGSPAINAGADVGLKSDYLGNAIIDTPDIGAFEYKGASIQPPELRVKTSASE